ncbi:MAG: hypothetical protein GY906_34685, partial [bacterium]|nr:hypothetical protein [bacterium]
MATTSYIIQGTNLAQVRAVVEAAGGEITHELGVIHAVGAKLTPTQQEALQSSTAVRLYDNRRIATARKKAKKRSTSVEPIDTSASLTSEITTDASRDTGATSASLDSQAVIDTSTGTSHVTGVMAHQLQSEGITGAGVTLAVLDSGMSDLTPIKRDTSGGLRALA